MAEYAEVIDRDYEIDPGDGKGGEYDAEEYSESEYDEDTDAGDLVYHDEDSNLVHTFVDHPKGRKALDEIRSWVTKCFDEDLESSSEYRERRGKDWKLFAGYLPSKDYPFEDAANCNVPILIESFSRVHSQLMAEIFGDWSNFVGVQAVGPDDDALADTMGLHLNWQFTEDIEDWPRQASRATMQFLWGDVSCYSYWDKFRERNRHEVCTPDDLIVPYTHTSTAHDYGDCPRTILVRYYYRNEIQSEEGWWGVEKFLRKKRSASWEDEPDAPVREAVTEVQGMTAPESGDTTKIGPFKILQYDGWDCGYLPGQDRDRFIRVTMDYETGHIFALTIQEQPDWKEQVRYRQQLSEFVTYTRDLEYFQKAKLYATRLEAVKSGAPPEMPPLDLMGGGAQGEAMPMPGPEERVRPVRPSWMGRELSLPQRPQLRPVRMFTHAVCIEPMAGVLGLGYLNYVADYQRMANTALNQFTDSATLANSWTLLLARGLEIGDDFSFGPGKINYIDGASASSNELQNGIREFKASPANPQLRELVNDAKAFAEGTMQASPVLSGDPGKSGETWRGHAARLEAATKQLSVRGRVLTQNFFRHVFRKNCELNAIFLKDIEIVSLMDWRIGQRRDIPISRDMYMRNYDVQIRADLRFASEAQRVQEATELVSLGLENPYLQGNAAFQHAAVKKLLEARRNHELVALLGEPPPPPPEFSLPQPAAPEGAPPPQ